MPSPRSAGLIGLRASPMGHKANAAAELKASPGFHPLPDRGSDSAQPKEKKRGSNNRAAVCDSHMTLSRRKEKLLNLLFFFFLISCPWGNSVVDWRVDVSLTEESQQRWLFQQRDCCPVFFFPIYGC